MGQEPVPHSNVLALNRSAAENVLNYSLGRLLLIQKRNLVLDGQSFTVLTFITFLFFFFYLTLILLRCKQQPCDYIVTGQLQEPKDLTRPATVEVVFTILYSSEASLLQA